MDSELRQFAMRPGRGIPPLNDRGQYTLGVTHSDAHGWRCGVRASWQSRSDTAAIALLPLAWVGARVCGKYFLVPRSAGVELDLVAATGM